MIFSDFVQWAFLSILSGCIIFATKVLFDMKESIANLNMKIAVILEKMTFHEQEIKENKQRIKDLENGRMQ